MINKLYDTLAKPSYATVAVIVLGLNFFFVYENRDIVLKKETSTSSVILIGYTNGKPSTYTFKNVETGMLMEINYRPNVINKDDIDKYKSNGVMCILYTNYLYESGRNFNRIDEIENSKGSCSGDKFN